MRPSASLIARSAASRLWSASADGRVFRGMVAASLFVAVTRIVGAAKEMAVASAYGASATVDAYNYLTGLFTWPTTILSGAMMTVFVPFLVRSSKHAPEDLALFLRELVGSLLLIGAAIGAFAALAASGALSSGATGLPAQTSDLARNMVAPIALTIPVGIYSAFLAANIMAQSRQTNTILEGAPAFCILAVLLTAPSHSPDQLAWATLAGFGVQAILLMLAQPADAHFIQPAFSWRSPAWRDVTRGLGVVIAGQVLGNAPPLADQIMLAPLGAGALAVFGYASRVIALFTGLGATAISRAILPVLSGLHADEPQASLRVANRWTLALFLGGAVASLAAWIAAPWGIKLLFEHGAFTANDAGMVVEAFRYGLAQLPFYFAGMVLVQALAASGDFRIFLYVGGLNVSAKVAANALLIPIFGVEGAMLGTSIMYVASFAALWFFTRK